MQIIVAALAAVAAVAAGFFAVSAGSTASIIFLGCALVALLAFFSPKASLVLLIFSMLLSPEMNVGAVSASRSAVVRYDDLLLVIIFMSWFARTSIMKDKPFLAATPPQTPILLYAVLAVVSTGLGVLRGDVRAEVAVFYVLKYVQYFLLYFVVVNVLDSKEQLRKYLKYAGVVAFLVTIYAYYYYLGSGPDARASAPFEAPLGNPKESEPASLGGYYLIVFSFLFALMTEVSGRQLLLTAAGLAFMFPAFLLTFSRASYIGLAGVSAAMLLLSAKRRAFMFFFLIAGVAAIFLAPGISGKVVDRITMTYSGAYATNTYRIAGSDSIKLEDSAAARVKSLNSALMEKLPKHPILGWGVTGIGLGDTQYALVLGELGLAGLLVFFWMLWRVYQTARAVYAYYGDPWVRALSLGMMCALPGLLLQGFGVNTFIIVRIMEPFWFMAAMLAFLYSRIPREGAAGLPRPDRESAR